MRLETPPYIFHVGEMNGKGSICKVFPRITRALGFLSSSGLSDGVLRLILIVVPVRVFAGQTLAGRGLWLLLTGYSFYLLLLAGAS